MSDTIVSSKEIAAVAIVKEKGAISPAELKQLCESLKMADDAIKRMKDKRLIKGTLDKDLAQVFIPGADADAVIEKFDRDTETLDMARRAEARAIAVEKREKRHFYWSLFFSAVSAIIAALALLQGCNVDWQTLLKREPTPMSQTAAPSPGAALPEAECDVDVDGQSDPAEQRGDLPECP